MIRRIYLLPSLLLFLTAGAALASGDKPVPPAKPLTVAQLPEFRVSRGAVIYERYCTFCHGESGRGDGLNAYLLPVRPADLGDPELQAEKSDRDLARVILQGGLANGLSAAMPSFAKTISSAQATELVKHIRTAFKHAPEENEDNNEL